MVLQPTSAHIAPASNRPLSRPDWVKWAIFGAIGLSVALFIAGVAFLAGYLTALHALAGTLHQDQATIGQLSSQLQARSAG
ncbi:hypothetical protein [Sulfobacillus harzensis]|uniref:Uncharacterized protein n=1 Tax=Sulfobacillus harzensis TaxID=2729629 RepID=A0A7Y0Q3Z0_9FIRM|nr:hypothetical protein [Sulfobacillus harzensis]NMP23870.1 hypothetical protein [Sulfobacillus harzensis]